MKVIVLSCYDDRRKEIGELAKENVREWCGFHDYAFLVQHEKEFKQPYFAKLSLILSELNRWRDIVVWLDSDCFIFDKTKTVADLNLGAIGSKPVSVSTDSSGVCAGMMVFKPCDFTRDLVRTWLFLGNDYKSITQGYPTDQDTLKDLLHYPVVNDGIARISQDVVSNQEHIPAKPFIHHYWATNKDQVKLVEHVKADLAAGRPSNFHKTKL